VPLTEYTNNDDFWQERWIRLGITSGFGISVFILVELISEVFDRKRSSKWLVFSGVAALFLILFYRWIPVEGGERILNVFFIRFLMLAAVVHLAIAVIPFWKLKEADGSLWEYNKVLFTKFLLTGFFSAIFYVGIVLALVSIDKLFGVDIDEENYLRIWFFCAFVLNTCLFMGGMPTGEQLPQLRLDYPKWIHFFCKFILLPLVLIYFSILYAYSGKIVFTWSLPNGLVGLPVFILAAIGGLTGLLIWPLSRVEPITAWAKTFWRLFFPLFVPLSVLLLLALKRRVGDYGFTEVRYMGIVLGIWILAVSAYFSWRPVSSFKLIPWSLIGVFLLCSFGPISPANVAKASQWKRLVSFLEGEGLLVDGTLVSNPHEVDHDAYENLQSMILYLRKGYGFEIFEPLVEGMNLDDRKDNNGDDWSELLYYSFNQDFLTFTGISWDNMSESNFLNIVLDPQAAVQVDAATNIFQLPMYFRRNNDFLTVSVHGEEVKVYRSGRPMVIEFKNEAEQLLASIDFDSWVDSQDLSSFRNINGENPSMSQEILSFSVDLVSIGKVKLIAQRLNLSKPDNGRVVDNGDFWILVPRS
jgi:hypothetical protein